jgi:hypothetical protein
MQINLLSYRSQPMTAFGRFLPVATGSNAQL